MSIKMYCHGGSGNHGCEALVRTTLNCIPSIDVLYTTEPEEDYRYGIEKNIVIKKQENSLKNGIVSLIYKLKYKILKDDKIFFQEIYKNFFGDVQAGDVYLSIGGDNYCYDANEWLKVLNGGINKRKGKTVLWGCSIESKDLNNEMLEDLDKYSVITARESITYNALKETKLRDKVYYCPDTAFLLPVQEPGEKQIEDNREFVGINISPVVIERESSKGIVLQSYLELVNNLLRNTNYNVLLIPHVVKTENNDLEILNTIKSYFVDEKRVIVLQDQNCMKLKWYISKCKVFIGARTHSTIAAYSMGVPTLVVGYSVKAKGIAKDLFGTDENYVLPTQDIKSKDELWKSFLWIEKHSEDIKEQLMLAVSNYEKYYRNTVEIIQKLAE